MPDLGRRTQSIYSEPALANALFRVAALLRVELFGVLTVSRALTMSYQPGMLIPKFCRHVSKTSSQVEDGIRTTVIGIVGALGNMNLISSNFPLRRQFSAKPILGHPISVAASYSPQESVSAHQPAPL